MHLAEEERISLTKHGAYETPPISRSASELCETLSRVNFKRGKSCLFLKKSHIAPEKRTRAFETLPQRGHTATALSPKE